MLPPVVAGFHGCDQSTYEDVLNRGAAMQESNNDYDWLGPGVYFWQESETRAWDWARECKARGTILTPSVIKANIELRNCLDLLQEQYREELVLAHRLLTLKYQLLKKPLPVNKLKLHRLDCAVIVFLHQYRIEKSMPAYDTVRAIFQEGEPIYPGSCVLGKDHIQIAVRTPACIKTCL